MIFHVSVCEAYDAMGNHAKGLDPFTEYVTAEVEKDGIAQAIRHYGLD